VSGTGDSLGPAGPATGDSLGPAGPATGDSLGPAGPATGETDLPRGVARRARRRRRRRVLFGAAGVVVVVLGGLFAWFWFEAHPLGGPGRNVVLTIAPNQSVGATVDALARDGVISSSFFFRVDDVLQGNPTVEPGSYLFRANQPFSTVRAILARGPDISTLVVPEGFSLSEVAQRVTDLLPTRPVGSFLRAEQGGAVSSPYEIPGSNNLEGTIAPGTYRVLPGETSVALLRQMVDRFDRQAAGLGLPAAAGALGVTPAQLVVVASIVEKEGEYPKNMGKVARVVFNRLKAGSPLQMDSTVLYALGQDGGPVTAADLALRSPYNTYLHTGLPPTAICTPSRTALVSAAHPTPGAWLYFQLVSKDGTEQFSDTYAEQLAAEALAKSRGLP